METQKNATSYQPLSKAVHWVVALAVLIVFITAMMMESSEDMLSPEGRKLLYMIHKSTGFFVLCMMLFRIVWTHIHRPPPLPENIMPRWQVLAARLVHKLLYLTAILTPLLGWMLVSMGPYGLDFYGLFSVPSLPLGWLAENADAAHMIKEAHEAVATVFAGLIVVHVGATVLHHFVDRDDVLLRISPVCLHGWLIRIRGS